MGPFDRFNDRAKRVLALSQDEAIRFNHNYIGPEHLLLGLVREGEGVAARALEQYVELSTVRMTVEKLVSRGEHTQPRVIVLSPETKQVIDFAIDEMRKLGHSHVETEHLLLGVLRQAVEAESVAAKVFAALGVDLQKVRSEVVAILADPARQRGPHGPVGSRAEPAPTLGPNVLDAEGKRRDWYCEDVLSGKLRVDVLYQDERVLGFRHPFRYYQTHGVVIPKTHVASVMAEEALDGELLTAMLRGVQAVAKALGLDAQGFRLEANSSSPGVTPHMHWHIAGPGLQPPLAPREHAGARPVVAAAGRGRGPFSRFDDAAKRVLALAQDEAIRLNHNYIGTEHLLAGLVRHESGAAALALQDLGVELSKVRTALEFIVGPGDEKTKPSDITLSPRTKEIIVLAVDEADKLGHPSVGPAHLLLGLVREGGGIASGILESLGVSLETVRHRVIERLERPH